MRYLLLPLLCSGLILAGCQKVAQEQPNPTALLKPVDLSKEPSFTQQYKLGAFSVGSWVNQKIGQTFSKVTPNHPDAAIVYLYRPDSRWNRQEIAAANLFINDYRIPSLLSNHYYWIEVPAGSYRLSVSRPLTGIHFQKPKYMDLTVEAGQEYFVKYDEENRVSRREKTGPWMLMEPKVGLREINRTQLKSSSYSFVAEDAQGQTRRKPLEVKAPAFDPDQELSLQRPFKLWNPKTW